MINKAIYSVERVDHGARIVWIIDEDGPKSITNDAERVVADVNSNYRKYRIVYRDTEGRWDELLHNDGTFTDFRPGAPLP